MSLLRDLPKLCDEWATTRQGIYAGNQRSTMPERMWTDHRCTNIARFRLCKPTPTVEVVCGRHAKAYEVVPLGAECP